MGESIWQRLAASFIGGDVVGRDKQSAEEILNLAIGQLVHITQNIHTHALPEDQLRDLLKPQIHEMISAFSEEAHRKIREDMERISEEVEALKAALGNLVSAKEVNLQLQRKLSDRENKLARALREIEKLRFQRNAFMEIIKRGDDKISFKEENS